MTLNYPLLVAGFSDADKTFFPTYAAISSHEDTWSYKGFLEAVSQAGNYKPKLLVADRATQTTAACHEVFTSAERGMCYAHVTMDLNRDLPKARICQEACEEIKNDVAKLAMASSLLELAAASRTLYEHWQIKWRETPRLLQACEKFFRSWLFIMITEDPDWVFSTWQTYKTLRESFFVMRYSAVFPGYISCSCPIGIKDGLCKHSLLLMETEKLIDPFPRPLEPRMKRGRKKKVGQALERI